VFRDIGQDLATSTQFLAAHSLGSAPQDSSNPAKENAEKIADLVSSLKLERGGKNCSDPRCMTSTRLI